MGLFVNACTFTSEDIDLALSSSWRDFEDACINQVAHKVKPDAVVTDNVKDYALSDFPVFDCDGLLPRRILQRLPAVFLDILHVRKHVLWLSSIALDFLANIPKHIPRFSASGPFLFLLAPHCSYFTFTLTVTVLDANAK